VLDEIAQTVILSEAKNPATSIAKGFHQVKKRRVFFDQLELAGNGSNWVFRFAKHDSVIHEVAHLNIKS